MSPLLQPRHPWFAPALALLVGLFALPATAADSDFRVLGGYSVQEKSLEFNLLTVPIDFRQSSSIFSIGAAARGFYVLVEMERPFSQDTISVKPGSTPLQFTLQREDNTLTLGYNLWRTLNIFAGRKTGSTELQRSALGSSTDLVQVEYRESGNFVGLSYNADFGVRGQLGLSLAYANLPTKVTETVLGTSIQSITTTGTTTGTSYGIKWTGTLTDRLDYNIGYKLSKYKFTDKAQATGDDYSTNQTYKIFSVGISKVF